MDAELLLGHRVTSTEEIKQVLKVAYYTPALSEKPQFLMEGSLDQDFIARCSERLIENPLHGIYIPFFPVAEPCALFRKQGSRSAMGLV
jgi:hypothetical protein